MPKALLPIANQPMISYPLSWLEASGVSGMPCSISYVSPVCANTGPRLTCFCPFLLGLLDVIVVSLSSGSKKLGHYLDRVYEGSGSLHITLEVVDDNTGTADALALIKDKIKVNRKRRTPLPVPQASRGSVRMGSRCQLTFSFFVIY